MTPGAGTAQSVGRVGRRQMWRVAAGSWFCVGHPGVTSGARAFAGRSNVVLRWLVRGVARRGAIYDARCRNGTIGRPRWASADVACCGRFVVLLRPFCGFAVVIRASQVAPPRLGAVERCFASVVRASQVAPPRLRAVECCFASAVLRHCVGRPGVTSGAPTFGGG